MFKPKPRGQKYDVILVLGVGTKKKLFKKRVDKTISLYRKLVAPKIIFSGKWWGGAKIKPKKTEARSMMQYALLNGIPRKVILLEERSLDTIGNFYFTKKYILKPHRFFRILVITHKDHFPKAKYIGTKILGDKYHLTFLDDDSNLTDTRRQSDLMTIRKYLNPIKNGDDRAITKARRFHPYYKSYRKF